MPYFSRDPLYELEMTRAALADAERQPGSPPALLAGLQREIDWWTLRAVAAATGAPSESRATFLNRSC